MEDKLRYILTWLTLAEMEPEGRPTEKEVFDSFVKLGAPELKEQINKLLEKDAIWIDCK